MNPLGLDLNSIYRADPHARIWIFAFFVIYVKNSTFICHSIAYQVYNNPANSFSRIASILVTVTFSIISPLILRLGPLLQRPMHRDPLKMTLSSRWFFFKYSRINITTSLFPLEKQELPKHICISIVRVILLFFENSRSLKNTNFFQAIGYVNTSINNSLNLLFPLYFFIFPGSIISKFS